MCRLLIQEFCFIRSLTVDMQGLESPGKAGLGTESPGKLPMWTGRHFSSVLYIILTFLVFGKPLLCQPVGFHFLNCLHRNSPVTFQSQCNQHPRARWRKKTTMSLSWKYHPYPPFFLQAGSVHVKWCYPLNHIFKLRSYEIE